MSSEDFDDIPQLVDVEAGLNEAKENAALGEELSAKVPITIVTGYLGSGKSTLLNYISTQKKRQKIAIILNEFGDSADIERSMVVKDGQQNMEYEEWLELDNGCLCCTVKDNGVVAIENLMKRKGKFDYILLETTGVADPAPIANMFWLDEGLSASIYLDGIVTVIDVQNLERNLKDGSTTEIQISHADVLILNKVDKLETKALDVVRKTVKDINSLAPIIETSYSKVPLDDILDLKAYSTVDDKRLQALQSVKSARHNEGVRTVSKTFGVLREEQIEVVSKWLQVTLWEKVVVNRTKGLLITDGKVYGIQGVRDVYEITEVSPDTDLSESKIVLIGNGDLLGALDDLDRMLKS